MRTVLNRHKEAGAPLRITNGVNGEIQSGAEPSELQKELEDVQKQFEAYRMEMGVDSTRLREETLAAQREATKLGTALAKANAQIEVLTGWHTSAFRCLITC